MSFKSELAEQGIEFDIATNETVLEAALRQNISLPYGCRNGACGACKAKLVSGSVSYGGELPPAINEQESMAGMALLCQARPTSDLVIQARTVDSGTSPGE